MPSRDKLRLLVHFVLCRLMGCCTSLGCCVAYKWDFAYVYGTVTFQAIGFSVAYGRFVVVPHQADWLLNWYLKSELARVLYLTSFE